jgi:hypothetical protein
MVTSPGGARLNRRRHSAWAYLALSAVGRREELAGLRRGFLVGSLGEGPTQVLMSRPGIEPGACGLKVRFSNRPFAENSGKTRTSRPGDRNKAD